MSLNSWPTTSFVSSTIRKAMIAKESLLLDLGPGSRTCRCCWAVMVCNAPCPQVQPKVIPLPRFPYLIAPRRGILLSPPLCALRLWLFGLSRAHHPLVQLTSVKNVQSFPSCTTRRMREMSKRPPSLRKKIRHLDLPLPPSVVSEVRVKERVTM